MRNIEIIRLNKIKASIIITILLIGSISGVWAVTRTISGTQDNIETFIRNSNGKYWTATASNIQLAIWDLNDTGGTVYGVGNQTEITISTSITITQSNIIFRDFKLKLDDSVDDAIIKIGDGTNSYENIRILFCVLDGNKANNAVGYGIYFNTHITNSYVKDCYISECDNNAIMLYSTSLATGNHYNHFMSINTYHCSGYSIYIGTQSNDNTVIDCQSNSDGNGYYSAGADWNKFSGCTVLDSWQYGIRVGQNCQVICCDFEFLNGIEMNGGYNTCVGNIFWASNTDKATRSVYACHILAGSEYNIFNDNLIKGYGDYTYADGIKIYSGYNIISENNIMKTSNRGILLSTNSNHNSIKNNLITNATNYGITFITSVNNSCIGNLIFNSGINSIKETNANSDWNFINNNKVSEIIVTNGANTVCFDNMGDDI